MRRGQSVLCGALGVGLIGLLPALAQAAPIFIPNGSFESTPVSDSLSIIYGGPGGTITGPETASISGWNVVANPTTANGGTYSSGGYTPQIQAAWGAWDGSRGGPWYYGAPSDGSVMLDFLPGEAYGNSGVVQGALPGASFSATTTGITADAVVGELYTAKIDTANINKDGYVTNGGYTGYSPIGADMTLEILANGVEVASTTLPGTSLPNITADYTGDNTRAAARLNSTITTTWTADAAHANDNIQLEVVATHFLEGQPNDVAPGGGAQYAMPIMAIDNARLDGTLVPEPSTFAGIAGVVGLLLISGRRRRWA
jgi:hypothetical protein